MATEKRLIYANELIDWLHKNTGFRGNCEDCTDIDCLDCIIENAIKNAPTVDAVEVVRKPVYGYEGLYVVDQFGRVFGVDRTTTVADNGRIYEKTIAGKQMKQSVHTKGYKTVTLTKDGKSKTCFVHRLVAEAFIYNPNDLPMVNHKDEDKTNNFVENLEWCTASYNRTYGKGGEKQARRLRGKKHTEEHKRKISDSMKKHYAEKDDFCSYGERRTNGD